MIRAFVERPVFPVALALQPDLRPTAPAQDDTPLHQALREALVNTLVHSDYSDRASVRIIKRPSGFEFRNPGLLRVPAKAALQGGESDCRNRTLQQMFLMINLGERAGSGLPKIRQAWQAAGGQLELNDSFEPYDQTSLRMAWQDTAEPEIPEKTSEKTTEDTATRILALLRGEPTLSARKLAQQLQLSARAVELQLARLKSSGKLHRIGPAKGGHWQVIE
ncbi:ATP-binding protein [Stutzerimonas stutzeri]